MQWRSYTSINATELDEIAFQGLATARPIVGTALSRGGLVILESTALVFSGFALAGVITNLELRLHVDRLARIQDKIIQLWYDGRAQGSNLADLSAEDVWVYRWNNLDLTWSESHGVLIDLQPHTSYPSANTVYIRSVELRTV